MFVAIEYNKCTAIIIYCGRDIIDTEDNLAGVKIYMQESTSYAWTDETGTFLEIPALYTQLSFELDGYRLTCKILGTEPQSDLISYRYRMVSIHDKVNLPWSVTDRRSNTASVCNHRKNYESPVMSIEEPFRPFTRFVVIQQVRSGIRQRLW